METKDKNYKDHLIAVIQKAEEKAKDTIVLSWDQDLSEIEEYKFDIDLYKELISQLMAKTINRHDSIRNYYKAANEEFAKRLDSTEWDNNDRLDFIATVLQSYLDWEPDDKQGIERKLDAIGQIQNLEAIVYETRTLELKKKAYLKILEKMTKEQPQQEKDPLPDNPYPEIFEDAFAFRVFERLYDRYKDSETLLADFGFIYRKMHNAGMIKEYFRPEMYKSWLSKEPYNIVLEHGLKTLSNCTSKAKVNAFKDSIELVQKQYGTVS